MPHDAGKSRSGLNGLTGHALRNANLRLRSLVRSQAAPPLAKAAVKIRAKTLGMTRLEFAHQSGMSRGALRDMELGIGTPTCLTMRRFLEFAQKQKVSPQQVEKLCQLYAGAPETVPDLISRFELRAGSLRNLARKAGLSPATLWEYRRGKFPLSLSELRRFCRLVGEDEPRAELVWESTERQRLIARGYPPAWAEMCMMCAREGRSESYLRTLGVTSNTLKRLCYFELPPWDDVAQAAKTLCRTAEESRTLKTMWLKNAREQQQQSRETFGERLMKLREQRGHSRREIADLFRIGGKKPARIIKHIEEDGMYSMQAFPAGLVALLTTDTAEQSRLLDLWREHRRQFHCRRRPETRVEVRLTREQYGFEIPEAAKLLGYTNLEYQKVERGIEHLLDSATTRIIAGLHQAGQKRIQDLFQYQRDCENAKQAWKNPVSVSDVIKRLAEREGGLLPLVRSLRSTRSINGWTRRLRAIARGEELPTWPELTQIARTAGVVNLNAAHRDWLNRYRVWLTSEGHPPLATELRLLIAEVSGSLREFSSRLPFHYAVLIRDLQQIGRHQRIKWFHVERILTAAKLAAECERWRSIHSLWLPLSPRRKETLLGAERSR